MTCRYKHYFQYGWIRVSRRGAGEEPGPRAGRWAGKGFLFCCSFLLRAQAHTHSQTELEGKHHNTHTLTHHKHTMDVCLLRISFQNVIVIKTCFICFAIIQLFYPQKHWDKRDSNMQTDVLGLNVYCIRVCLCVRTCVCVCVSAWLPRHNHNCDQRDNSNVKCHLTAKYSSAGKCSAAAGSYFPLTLYFSIASSMSLCSFFALWFFTSAGVCVCVFACACVSICAFMYVHCTGTLARLGTLTRPPLYSLPLSASDYTQTTTNTHTHGSMVR